MTQEGGREKIITKLGMTSGTGERDITMTDMRMVLSRGDMVFAQREKELSDPRSMTEQTGQSDQRNPKDLKDVREALMRTVQITRIVRNTRITRVEMWQQLAWVLLVLHWVSRLPRTQVGIEMIVRIETNDEAIMMKSLEGVVTGMIKSPWIWLAEIQRRGGIEMMIYQQESRPHSETVPLLETFFLALHLPIKMSRSAVHPNPIWLTLMAAIRENASQPKRMIQTAENVVGVAPKHQKGAQQILVLTAPCHLMTRLVPSEAILGSSDLLVWEQPQLSIPKIQWV
jgi:hypothetical protein